MKTYLSARWRSFLFACNGLKMLLKQEPHIKIHLLATILVLLAGALAALDRTGWILILVAIGMVWITEIINTAIERLCDLYTTAIDERIRIIKDMSAAAVLVAAIIAILIGCFVFIPRLFL